MKPQELYQQWSQFEAMSANTTLSNTDKIALGEEWIRALPPRQLCTSSILSYDIVKNAMLGRLNDIKGNTDGCTSTTEKKEERQEPKQVENRASEKPVRKDAGDGRGKSTVENLDRPKVSKTKR